MKILIASDLHGSAFATELVLKAFEREKADMLILLGDIYNHGPRNPFPKEYDPMKVSTLLNAVKEKLVVIKGNCDSQVDTLISQFDFMEDMCLCLGEKKIFLTHGHIYNKDNAPKTKFDAVIYGHFHTGFIEKAGDTVFANAGSVALPKDNTVASYIVIENNAITLKNMEGGNLQTQIL